MLFAIRSEGSPYYLATAEVGRRDYWTDKVAEARKFSTVGDLSCFVEANEVRGVMPVELDPETFAVRRVVEVAR